VDRLIRILAEMQADPDLAARIGPGADIINELGLDSLQMINLALRVEDEFQITIDFETFDLDTLLSVEAFWQFIELMMAERAAPGDAA
jgi:acyl carrier protein